MKGSTVGVCWSCTSLLRINWKLENQYKTSTISVYVLEFSITINYSYYPIPNWFLFTVKWLNPFLMIHYIYEFIFVKKMRHRDNHSLLSQSSLSVSESDPLNWIELYLISRAVLRKWIVMKERQTRKNKNSKWEGLGDFTC